MASPILDEMNQGDLKALASMRLWAMWVGHVVFAPASSLYYGIKTGYWTPFGVGTAVGLVGLVMMPFDAGLTLGFGSTVASGALLHGKCDEARRELGVDYPEQAEKLG